MNGKAAKRIRLATRKTLDSTGTTLTFKQVYKRLKREYKALPYHLRKLPKGIKNKPHRVELACFWNTNQLTNQPREKQCQLK